MIHEEIRYVFRIGSNAFVRTAAVLSVTDSMGSTVTCGLLQLGIFAGVKPLQLKLGVARHASTNPTAL
jgi:hypothetical protein